MSILRILPTTRRITPIKCRRVNNFFGSALIFLGNALIFLKIVIFISIHSLRVVIDFDVCNLKQRDVYILRTMVLSLESVYAILQTTFPKILLIDIFYQKNKKISRK